MTVAFIGIDLAKNMFQLHGANADGKAVLKRRIRREGLLAEVAELEPCVIGVEACTRGPSIGRGSSKRLAIGSR